MIRVLFRANDNGQEFPVYFDDESKVSEAAEKLNSVEVSRRPATPVDLMLEQIATIGNWQTNRMKA